MIGEVIGSYRIVSELGRGGMGMVYRAEHVQLGRPAALKMLLSQLSSDASIVQRFFNEARAASAIDHPGIVEIYDFGTHTDGRAYIVMALLKGESLEQRLRRGALPPQDGATIVAQTVAALAAAHARGIVHRDLKPDNIFLVPNDLMPGGIQVKLLDFGIAKLADERTAGFKTETGTLIGTPAYMSPEQCMGRADLDHRTDLYSIGCILFHVFCGRPPFTSNQGTGMMIAAHIRDAAPDPRSFNLHLPEALATIVLRCLEKEPAARYQTATELRNALVAAGANAPPSRPAGADLYEATVAAPLASPPPVITDAPTLAAPLASPPPVVTHAPTLAAPLPSPPPVVTHAADAAAVTTQGRAAAQIAAPAPAAGAPRSRAALVAGGLLVALAAAGAVVAMTRGGHDDPTGAVAGTAAPPPASGRAASASMPPPASEGSARDVAPPAPPTGSAAPASPPPPEPTCPPGQTRRDDTHGHCCWPAQAWSISAGKCVGAPTCPEGMIARREQCVANDAASPPGVARKPPGSSLATTKTTAAPSFRLDATSYAPGDPIEIRFAAPVSSPPQRRAWVTVIEADRPASAYGAWSYLDDGATVSTLRAPPRPGMYEVRLHTDYPAKTFNVQRAVPFTVEPASAEPEPGPAVTPASAQRFTVAARRLHLGAKIDVTFAAALRAKPGERFWITVVPAGAEDTAWGAYEYVPAGARRMQLAAPTKPGDYEVRLHANYPTKSTNLVHHVAIRVED
jgi:serine/threonine-protein kinase